MQVKWISKIVALLIPMCLVAHSKVVTPELLEFLKEMHIEHDGSLASIASATQAAKWQRPLQKERWQIDDLNEEERGLVICHAEKLGFMQPFYPKNNHYDYAVLLGGATFRMEKRMKFLIELWNAGCRFDHVVLLGGERKLDPKVEKIPRGCTKENEAGRAMWKEMEMPEGLRKVPVVYVCSPMIYVFQGKRRPGLADTMSQWLKMKPRSGSCLFISNQPYIHYQDAIIRAILPSPFTSETVGAEAKTSNINAADILDSMTRWLCQEKTMSRNL